MNAPERVKRRLQFSLRTLFVFVTLVAIALAWVAHVKRFVELRRLTINQEPGEVHAYVTPLWGSRRPFIIVDDEFIIQHQDSTKEPGRLRRWLGDESIVQIMIPFVPTEEQRQELCRSFPEASIIILPDSGERPGKPR